MRQSSKAHCVFKDVICNLETEMRPSLRKMKLEITHQNSNEE